MNISDKKYLEHCRRVLNPFIPYIKEGDTKTAVERIVQDDLNVLWAFVTGWVPIVEEKRETVEGMLMMLGATPYPNKRIGFDASSIWNEGMEGVLWVESDVLTSCYIPAESQVVEIVDKGYGEIVIGWMEAVTTILLAPICHVTYFGDDK